MAILSTVAELRAAIGGNSIKVCSDHDYEFYSEVVRRVSGYALAKVQSQVKLLQDLDNEAECAGVFNTTWGLPCVQTIASQKQSGGILHMGGFHDQWNMKAICLFDDHRVPADGMQDDAAASELSDLVRKVQETYSILAPHQQMAMQMQLSHMGSQTFHLANPPAARHKGRPKRALNRRPPGILARSRSSTQRRTSGFEIVEASTGRKCGSCGIRETGHNARSCPVKLAKLSPAAQASSSPSEGSSSRMAWKMSRDSC
ncbi:hypothetical protein PsorP6_005973 [Peronosclerospora sorghi]|uniref:Uncharacterized protein n=1 Tax=Peronosclerospora sorghi TaxID=230839 RepID=A0ACC0W4U0_9STRA|nr:hypothetical protein PsorP6_005973 [Peronosclerospora sorghi]